MDIYTPWGSLRQFTPDTARCKECGKLINEIDRCPAYNFDDEGKCCVPDSCFAYDPGGRTHNLKILPKWFNEVSEGRKKFEIRKNDRDYKAGDRLVLEEWENGAYTGRIIKKKVDYVYYGDGQYGLEKGYCVLGLDDWSE